MEARDVDTSKSYCIVLWSERHNSHGKQKEENLFSDVMLLFSLFFFFFKDLANNIFIT